MARIIDRLEVGIAQGSTAAHDDLDRLRATLDAEAADGNPAATDALAALAP